MTNSNSLRNRRVTQFLFCIHLSVWLAKRSEFTTFILIRYRLAPIVEYDREAKSTNRMHLKRNDYIAASLYGFVWLHCVILCSYANTWSKIHRRYLSLTLTYWESTLSLDDEWLLLPGVPFSVSHTHTNTCKHIPSIISKLNALQ